MESKQKIDSIDKYVYVLYKYRNAAVSSFEFVNIKIIGIDLTR